MRRHVRPTADISREPLPFVATERGKEAANVLGWRSWRSDRPCHASSTYAFVGSSLREMKIFQDRIMSNTQSLVRLMHISVSTGVSTPHEVAR